MPAPENWELKDNFGHAVRAWENTETATTLEVRHTGLPHSDGYDLIGRKGHQEGLVADPGISSKKKARKVANDWMDDHPMA